MKKRKEIRRMKTVFYSVGIKSADLEDEFLFLNFEGFCVTMMRRNATECHVLVRVVRQIKMSTDWFRCIPCHFLQRLEYVRKL